LTPDLFSSWIKVPENVSLSFDKNKKINYLKISGEDCVTKNLSGE